jgi:hypothetical protein
MDTVYDPKKTLQAFPIAYFEFFEGDKQKRPEGPRTEAEEAELHDQWKASKDLVIFATRLTPSKEEARTRSFQASQRT